MPMPCESYKIIGHSVASAEEGVVTFLWYEGGGLLAKRLILGVGIGAGAWQVEQSSPAR